MTTPLQDLVSAHVALAATADDLVAQFVAKQAEIAASETALRAAYVDAHPGQASFAKAGQTALSTYMVTLANRILAGETREAFLTSVGDLAASGWEGVS